jgi:hypothetical protein
VYRLIKQEVYDVVRGIIQPYSGDWEPEDDLILRKDAEDSG